MSVWVMTMVKEEVAEVHGFLAGFKFTLSGEV